MPGGEKMIGPWPHEWGLGPPCYRSSPKPGQIFALFCAACKGAICLLLSR